MASRRREKRSTVTVTGPSSPVRAYHLAIVVVLMAGLYAAIQATLPHTAFLSNDGGAKLVQVRALLGHDALDPSIPYDPLGVERQGSFRYAPLFPKYAFAHDGKMFSIAPFYFPLASSLPFSAFGPAGLFILPWIGAVSTIGLVTWVAARSVGQAFALLGAVALGLSSSVFFYALTFWEHTVSMGLATAALVVLYRRWQDVSRFSPSVCAAGILLGVGCWMRLDVFMLTAGLAVAMAMRRNRRSKLLPLGVGLLLGLVPFFILNQLVYGSLWGPQLADGVTEFSSSTGLGSLLLARWRVTQYFLLAHVNQPWLDALFAAIAVGPAIYFRRIRTWGTRSEAGLLVWISLLLLVGLSTLYLVASMPRLLRSTMHVLGLWVALPLVPLAVARPRPTRDRSDDDFYAALEAMVLVALVVACATIALPGGLQWGPRYLLVLFPPLALLAVRGAAGLHERIGSAGRRRAFAVLLALLLAGGTALQIVGVGILKDKKLATLENNERVRAANPPVVVTDIWWFPQDSGDLMTDISIYKVPRGVQDPFLLAGLYRAGVRRALVVSRSDQRAVIAGSPQMRLTKLDRTHHPRTPTWDLYLHAVELMASPR